MNTLYDGPASGQCRHRIKIACRRDIRLNLINFSLILLSYYLGWMLSILAMTVDPEVFVIGGGVSKAGTFLTDMIEKYYDKFTPLSEKKAKLTLATLGNDAGIYGAARLILD